MAHIGGRMCSNPQLGIFAKAVFTASSAIIWAPMKPKASRNFVRVKVLTCDASNPFLPNFKLQQGD